ncbi:DUF4239 domain-containing protein [Roseomonas terrae]|uniref:DUF4239 domain-containing protein n=1 Tax=Neoroseomonas terrae TaxID=424799 RepID=A0ABS5EEI5_9PROT|nr:DUF4239 domain-containing protein [Neoroseomonas terrae]MBR0649435.1 DUF4239 domain-containing protein [Neoroseomonas terrae]
MDFVMAQEIAALPTAIAALVAIGAPVLIAMTVGTVMFAVFTPQELAANSVVGSVKFGFVVEVYAVVAALTLVGAWDIYTTSRDTLQKESGALYMLAHAVDTYGGAEQGEARQAMRGAIRDYAEAVVTHDWPRLTNGLALGTSDGAFTRLSRVFFDTEPVTPAQQALAQSTVAWVAQVAEARMDRLSVGTRTISLLIWALIMTVSVSVLVFQWFIGSGSQAVHYSMGAVIAIIVGGVLLVSLKLAFPFAGDDPLLSPRPFILLMDIR